MLRQDEDGRYPLSLKEYETVRYLYGVIDAFTRQSVLEERLRLIPGGWRDFRMLSGKAQKLFEQLLTTIPRKKLAQMRAELTNTTCYVNVRRASDAEGLTLVKTDALWDLCERCVQMDCMFCTKSAVEGRKCDIYRAVDGCLPYEFKGECKGACPLAGSAGLGGFESEDPSAMPSEDESAELQDSQIAQNDGLDDRKGEIGRADKRKGA